MNTPAIHHLTHEQLCDILLAHSADHAADQFKEQASPALEAAEDHLRSCLTCSSELEGLRRSLVIFRQAASSYAEHAYARPAMYRASIAPAPRFRSHVLYWATAAALAIAIALPFSLRHHSTPAPHPTAATVTTAPHNTQSDEALLDSIDQDLSADVPVAMEPLADPTGTAASSSAQRKN